MDSDDGSSGSARETFLNYFFGGPGGGTPMTSANHQVNGVAQSRRGDSVVPTGRDLSGGDGNLTTGLLAGKRETAGGSNVAFDMKSLGKHIEAVSNASCLLKYPTQSWRCRSLRKPPRCPYGKKWRPI